MTEAFRIKTGSAQLAGDKNGAGKPVIFLHAGVADRRMWYPQTADLRDSFQVVSGQYIRKTAQKFFIGRSLFPGSGKISGAYFAFSI